MCPGRRQRLQICCALARLTRSAPTRPTRSVPARIDAFEQAELAGGARTDAGPSLGKSPHGPCAQGHARPQPRGDRRHSGDVAGRHRDAALPCPRRLSQRLYLAISRANSTGLRPRPSGGGDLRSAANSPRWIVAASPTTLGSVPDCRQRSRPGVSRCLDWGLPAVAPLPAALAALRSPPPQSTARALWGRRS